MNPAAEELKVLVSAVRMLAASAEEQSSYLREIGVGELADELALELNDSLWTLPILIQQGVLTEEQAKDVRILDQDLDAMSGLQHKTLWRIEKLATAPEWQRIRDKARSILESFRT